MEIVERRVKREWERMDGIGRGEGLGEGLKGFRRGVGLRGGKGGGVGRGVKDVVKGVGGRGGGE